MKRLLLSLAALCLLSCSFIAAQGNSTLSPLWMRYPVISPDGSTIAFTFKGDIFTVSVNGGDARQITSNPAFDTYPIWSPDGTKICFASNRMGSMDIYIVSKEGGEPQRLTTFSGGEGPVAFLNNDTILFSCNIMPSAESVIFPGSYSQVYQVSVLGGRPKMFSAVPMESIVFNPDGKTFLFHDKKGYEDPWRKHHTSSITRDIWQGTLGDTMSFTKVTSFKGEDRNPVYSPDGQSFYYLSEEDGTFNVYKRTIAGGEPAKQITSFKGNPVRFLSISKDGTLCYGYDGEIYTCTPSGEQKKTDIKIIADRIDKDVIKRIVSEGADNMDVSKDGKQIAFTYHGDVYVTSDEYKTTKRITNTPEQERDVDFAPDGRSVIYSSERDGLWQIYRTSIVKENEKTFPYATDIKEERLTNSSVASFQPAFSPDGKEVAFFENRTSIKILNIASKAVRTAMEGSLQYSYADGDLYFNWSPDGKWILTNSIFNGGWNNQDIALVDASGNGKVYNLTKSGYSDSRASWVLDGKAMIWGSDRAGMRNHGSWGAEMDVYIMFFDLQAYEKFRMNKEDLALLEEAEKAEKEAAEKAKKDEEAKASKKSKKAKDSKKEEEKESETEPLKLDLDNAEYRVMRLTPNSCNLGDAVLSKKGDKLFYLASFEGKMDLWVRDLKDMSVKILSKGIGYGGLELSDDGNTIFMISNSGIGKINPESGAITPVPFEAMFDYKPYGEREYIFEHAWQQVKDKFYDPTIRGIDWAGYKETYSKFLPFINNNYDFTEMLSEMLGELNGSHTGARFYAPNSALQTACLGLFYDESYEGDGLKIKEIIKRGPLAVVPNEACKGCIIESIDGEKIIAGKDYYPLLEGKVGRKVILGIYDPAKGKRFDVTVKAVSYGQQNQYLYQRWVERNREEVERISGGKVGYVHIQSMDSPSFRVFYSEVLGRLRNKEALVVDTRHNGGGWLHDDIVTLLMGKEYQKFSPRGQYIGSDPYNKWLKPSCMLICEDNYSNAHGTPWVYKTLGVGKLIGAPVPGTMTAVWWERQIDQSIVFGIPEVGCMDMEGNYLENVELEPDILIYNAYEEVIRGFDAQLDRAAKEMMK